MTNPGKTKRLRRRPKAQAPFGRSRIRQGLLFTEGRVSAQASSNSAEMSTALQKRVRAIKLTLACFTVGLVSLAVAQGVQSASNQTGLVEAAHLLDDQTIQIDEVGSGTSGPRLDGSNDESSNESRDSLGDPLGLNQEGVRFVEASQRGDILWYHSTWNDSQSRILIERALVLLGWQKTSFDEEELMSFAYPPSATAAGAYLLLALYENESGCTILIELM